MTASNHIDFICGRLFREHWEADIDVEEISAMPPPRRSVRRYLLLASGLALTTVVVVRWRRHAS
jgi:hypothetical protein